MNTSLNTAKDAKQDEFYTRYQDIRHELKPYWRQLKGKKIYCNCDNPYNSNFVRYLLDNFNAIGIKQLTATCWNGKPPKGTPIEQFLFEELTPKTNDNCQAFKTVVTSTNDYSSRHLKAFLDKHTAILDNCGDFRTQECIDILKDSDVIVTNPPFSLFREFMAIIQEHNKDFILIGNINTIMSKTIFPLIAEGKAHLGTQVRLFEIPDHYGNRSNKSLKVIDGERCMRLGSTRWFISFPHPKPIKPLKLTQTYSPEKYQRFDNYDAINIDRTEDIPADYYGVMGVPITFIDKHCPKQFEILGISEDNGLGLSDGIITDTADTHPILNGNILYKRIFVRHKDVNATPKAEFKFMRPTIDGHETYSRIPIQRIQPQTHDLWEH